MDGIIRPRIIGRGEFVEEILKQILNELKEMRVDINELKQGQNRLEVGQEKLLSVSLYLKTNRKYK